MDLPRLDVLPISDIEDMRTYILNKLEDRKNNTTESQSSSLNVIFHHIKHCAEMLPNTKYIAMCNASVLDAYALSPKEYPIPEKCIPVEEFLQANCQDMHALKKIHAPNLGSTLIELAKFVPKSVLIDHGEPMYANLLFGFSADAPKQTRRHFQLVCNAIYAVSESNLNQSEDRQVYFQWLREIGEEL